MMQKAYSKYYSDVFTDIKELREHYPVLLVTLLPTVKPYLVTLKVIAVNYDSMEDIGATEDDFIGEYSRAVNIKIPFDYKKRGCRIWGGAWIRISQLKKEDMHFHEIQKDGSYEFCVGVPQSFCLYDNVLLENVKTVEHMLIAYKLLMQGATKELELLSYSHGEKGKKEYERKKAKIKTAK